LKKYGWENNLETDPCEPAGCHGNSHKAKLSNNNSCLGQVIAVFAGRQDTNRLFAFFYIKKAKFL
jgi:hypothetical protein